jgi:hypothetical protein
MAVIMLSHAAAHAQQSTMKALVNAPGFVLELAKLTISTETIEREEEESPF